MVRPVRTNAGINARHSNFVSQSLHPPIKGESKIQKTRYKAEYAPYVRGLVGEAKVRVAFPQYENTNAINPVLTQHFFLEIAPRVRDAKTSAPRRVENAVKIK